MAEGKECQGSQFQCELEAAMCPTALRRDDQHSVAMWRESSMLLRRGGPISHPFARLRRSAEIALYF